MEKLYVMEAYMNINQRLAEELKIELWQVEAAVKLIDEEIGRAHV